MRGEAADGAVTVLCQGRGKATQMERGRGFPAEAPVWS